MVFEDFVPGQFVEVTGSAFAPGVDIDLRIIADDGNFERDLGQLTADSLGILSATIEIPNDAPISAAYLEAEGVSAGGGLRWLTRGIDLQSSTVADGDGDGVPDLCDNCLSTMNPSQDDTDGDGIGDACDPCINDPEDDWDGDGLCADADSCPLDPDNDADGDGVCGEVDGCPGFTNADPDLAFPCLFGDGFESGDLTAWSSASP